MESEQQELGAIDFDEDQKSEVGTVLVNEDQKSEIVSLLRHALKEFRARYVHYFTIRARITVPIPARGNMSGTQSSGWSTIAATDESMNNHCYDGRIGSPENPIPPKPTRCSLTPMANAFLYNDPHQGYPGPGMGRLDGDGIYTLSRRVPRGISYLKIAFVERVQLESISSVGIVTGLVDWLDHRIAASQTVTETPKLNTRVVTNIDQIWELFARFETTEHEKSVIIQNTPIDLGSRLPIVELSFISLTHHTMMPLTSEATIMGPKGDSGEPTNKIADSTASKHQSLEVQIEKQEAEIRRITKSWRQSATKLRSANGVIVDLRNKLKEAERLRDLAVKKTNALAGRHVAFDEALAHVPSDSMQQASELSCEIVDAAMNLYHIVEAWVIIRPGVTERTLMDLQSVVDAIDETVVDIKNEPLAGNLKSTLDGNGNAEDDDAEKICGASKNVVE